jgi:hypothetical protein
MFILFETRDSQVILLMKRIFNVNSGGIYKCSGGTRYKPEGREFDSRSCHFSMT